MIPKSKENRSFGTFDSVAVIALGCVVAMICGTIVYEMMQDDSGLRARRGAEALAHQMVAVGFGASEPEELVVDLEKASFEDHSPDQKLKADGGRSPASIRPPSATQISPSEGSLGRDPWGRPFHYKVFRSTDGEPIRILVWSSGPNKRSETHADPIEVASSGELEQPIRFGGDDIGFAYTKP